MMIEVKYSELYKQLIGIIVIPLLLAAFFIILIYLIAVLKANEMVLIAFILGGSLVVVLLGVFMARKFSMINAKVECNINGLNFLLEKSSILYKENLVSVMFNNIQKISLDDSVDYRIYVKIKTSYPKKIIFVSPDKFDNNETFISYWNEIIEKIEEHKLM